MDELTITEIVRGIADESMKAQRFPLLQLLANKVADLTEPLTLEESNGVFIIALATLNSTTDESLVELMLGLLTNATISEQNAQSFMTFIGKNEKYRTQFLNVLETFLNHNAQAELDATDDAHSNMASVMCNLCQLEVCRELLLKPSAEYMSRMVNQIRSKSVVRRRGAVGCIRSCLFDKDIHWWVVVDLKAVDQIVLPLVVATPFTDREKEGMNPILWLQAEDPERQPEPDLEIMKMLLECIVLLCQRRGIREELRKLKVYSVVKNLDLKMEDEKISEIIYEIVNFLMGDEDHETPIDTYEHKLLK